MDFEYLKEDISKVYSIDSKLYEQLDVKRGLRNSDGSGVLAGLSRVSSVLGNKDDNGVRIDIDGQLRYRGILIEDLVADTKNLSRFEYVVFLLLVGRLPTSDELESLNQHMAKNRDLPKDVISHLIRPVPSKNIMNKLQTVVSALYLYDSEPESLDPYQNFIKSLSIISKMPMIVAASYLLAYETNPDIVFPDGPMSTASSLLYMLRQGNVPDPFEVEILDLALMLHAEHGGGNNSSFTTVVVTSSGADIYGTITAALGSLKGPLHGAANKKVMDMMSDIKQNVSNWASESELSDYLSKIIRKEVGDQSGKIYGLGHAVYTKSDPRATLLKQQAEVLAQKVGRLDEFNLYCLIESLAPSVFQSVKGSDKVISPNVDFFSGFVYDCLGIPKEIYTPMFAIARSVGWCAHRIEEILSGKRVIRPKYKFVS